MSILDSSVRHGASRVISSMLMMACTCPVLAQDSAAAQPDALDFTPPILKNVDVAGNVNAQALNQYVNVTIKLTDNLSGVASFVVDFRSPSGMHHVTRVKSIPLPRTSVTAEVSLGASPFSEPPFLKFAEPGTWTVYSLTATDGANNSRTYNEAQLRSISGHHTFFVTNNGGYDIVPPQFVSGVIDTPTVRLSKEPPGMPEGTPPYVSGRLNMTDSGNGVISGSREAQLMFCLAGSGSCQPNSSNTFTMSNLTNRAGLTATTLAIGTQLGKNQIPGNYLIYSLELWDAAGSHRKLVSFDFNGGNFDFHPGFPQGVAIFINQ
jgi:hypothetical protein